MIYWKGPTHIAEVTYVLKYCVERFTFVGYHVVQSKHYTYIPVGVFMVVMTAAYTRGYNDTTIHVTWKFDESSWGLITDSGDTAAVYNKRTIT